MTGYFFLDGTDLYLNFGLIIEMGEAEFLRYPPVKDSLEHDWIDDDGVEIDLSRNYFQKRECTLQCAILAPDEATFHMRRDAFIAQIIRPGEHRLEFKTHPGRQYFVTYRRTENWQQTVPLTGSAFDGLMGQKFSLVLLEPNPARSYSSDVQIALGDDEGRAIII